MARRGLRRGIQPGPEAWRLPPEWQEYGARWGPDSLLYLGEWRRGFTVHELRAMFFECQQVRGLTHENQRLKRETEDLQERIGRIERQRDFYQRQCRDAANMGLALLPFPET